MKRLASGRPQSACARPATLPGFSRSLWGQAGRYLRPWVLVTLLVSLGYGSSPRMPAKHTSRHLRLCTDLDDARAAELLQRLESVVRLCAAYWNRPLRQSIECFVVDDLASWPPDSLPSPQARRLLTRVGGAVDVDMRRVGNRNMHSATVYATSKPGIAEHEVVHAYCVAAFGCTGPDWYSEGMAQMVSQYCGKDQGVSWPSAVLDALRVAEHQTIDQIIGGGQFTDPLTALFRGPQTGDVWQDGLSLVPRPTRWRVGDDRTVDDARQSYYWSLALCHFLSHNANYSQRFRVLGQGYVQRKDVCFQREFASVTDQMGFEYRLFLAQLANGYRADLCSWDWSKEFLQAERAERLTAAVDARRGYQPSGLMVVAGQSYEFASTGTWKTGLQVEGLTADGNADGHGRLVASILSDFSLTEPLILGATGSFVSPRSGRLYLRCQDQWHELTDNQGVVRVTLRRTPAPSADNGASTDAGRATTRPLPTG